MSSIVTALTAAILLLSPAAEAREITVPVRLDKEFLRQALLTQVFTDPEGTASIWTDGTGCNYMTLSSPLVDTRDGRLRVVSSGEARVGTAIGERCLTVLNWSGFVEVFEEPEVDPSAPLVRFRVVDSNLYDRNWEKRFATGTLWDWVKQYVHPRLANLRVDLGGPLADLRQALPLFLSAGTAVQTQTLIDSVTLSAVQADDEGLTATIRFDVPEVAVAAAPTPEPALSPEEIERWESALQRWDAFLTFVVKQAGGDTGLAELREALLEVLLDGRYDMIEALAPSAPGAADPVRPLFLKSWERLAPVLRNLSTGLPGEAALRYLSFIAAADALRAIDQLGPQSGLDISADGLRRLARTVAPTYAEDPLAYSTAVEPELRQLFGFGAPLPLPEDNPEVDLSSWLLGTAWAALEPDQNLVARLNRWVPKPDEIDTYLPMVRDLLNHTVDQILVERQLENRYHKMFRWIVLATAWQETCWRQFVKVGSAIKPIKSPVGSIGLMQVNPHVWRGFYDVQALQKDIAYNGKAGSEIAFHYFADVAIAKKEHEKTNSLDNLARSTYAVYNGGPRHLSRYRNPKTSKGLRRVDEAFWKKYQAVKAGNEMAVAECFG